MIFWTNRRPWYALGKFMTRNSFAEPNKIFWKESKLVLCGGPKATCVAGWSGKSSSDPAGGPHICLPVLGLVLGDP